MSRMRSVVAGALVALALVAGAATPALAVKPRADGQACVNDDETFTFPTVRYRFIDSRGGYNKYGWRYSIAGNGYNQEASANATDEAHPGLGASFKTMEVAYNANSEPDIVLKFKVRGIDGSESPLITAGPTAQSITAASGADIAAVYCEMWYKGVMLTTDNQNYKFGMNIHGGGTMEESIYGSYNNDQLDQGSWTMPWWASYNNLSIDGFNMKIMMRQWKIYYDGAYTNGKTYDNTGHPEVNRAYRDTIQPSSLANPTGYHKDHDSANGDGRHYVTQSETVTRYFAPNTYAVSYEPNRPAGASAAVEGSTAASSHTYDAASPLTENGYSLTGWKFDGWNTKADGTGTAYTDGQDVLNLSATNGATVPLYAQWKPITYTVTYDGNGAYEGATEPTDMTYDKSEPARESGFGRTGWVFDGWNTKPDGTGDDYAPGDPMSNLTTVDGDEVPLYAKWELDMTMLSFSVPDTIGLRVLPDGTTVAPAGTYVENLSPWPLQVTAIDSAETGPWSITGDEAKENALTLALSPGSVPINGTVADTSAEASYLLGTGAAYDTLPGYEEGSERETLAWDATAARITVQPSLAPAANVTWHVEPRPV